jgi:hypothetical protein
MLLSLLYFAVRRLLRVLTANGDRDDAAREVEILVLRHQLRVLLKRSPAAAWASGSDPIGGGERALTSRPVALFPGLTADRALLASGAREAQMDLPARSAARPAKSCAGDNDADHPAGEREPALGLPANPRRTQEARRLHLRNRHLL